MQREEGGSKRRRLTPEEVRDSTQSLIQGQLDNLNRSLALISPSSEELRLTRTMLLVVFLGLIIILSVSWATTPPTFNPLVLLVGLLAAGALAWITRRLVAARKVCPTCARRILVPSDAAFCPYCGARLL